MPFTLDQFIRLRPYLFHLTDERNIDSIRSAKTISSARELCNRAKRNDLLGSRRRLSSDIDLDGTKINVRDQAPLHEGNIEFEGGWTFLDLIKCLNGRVFFWPGLRSGLPVSSGIRHFERYAQDGPRIVRVNTERLFHQNLNNEPRFCKYNSGSPRWTNGRASPRGPQTFVRAADASFGPTSVVECTFEQEAKLPNVIEVGPTPEGPWKALAL